MHHHIKMLPLYIQSIIISTELIANLQDIGDEVQLSQALDDRDRTWTELLYHLDRIVRGQHRHASAYARIVDNLICS